MCRRVCGEGGSCHRPLCALPVRPLSPPSLPPSDPSLLVCAYAAVCAELCVLLPAGRSAPPLRRCWLQSPLALQRSSFEASFKKAWELQWTVSSSCSLCFAAVHWQPCTPEALACWAWKVECGPQAAVHWLLVVVVAEVRRAGEMEANAGDTRRTAGGWACVVTSRT